MAPPRKLKVTRKELKEAYERFGSLHATAEHFGVAFMTVHKRMVKYGIPRNREGVQPKYPLLHDQEFLDNYDGTREELMELAGGCSMQAARDALQRSSWGYRRMLAQHRRKELGLKAHRDGLSVRSIADQLGVSTKTVYMWISQEATTK